MVWYGRAEYQDDGGSMRRSRSYLLEDCDKYVDFVKHEASIVSLVLKDHQVPRLEENEFPNFKVRESVNKARLLVGPFTFFICLSSLLMIVVRI